MCIRVCVYVCVYPRGVCVCMYVCVLMYRPKAPYACIKSVMDVVLRKKPAPAHTERRRWLDALAKVVYHSYYILPFFFFQSLEVLHTRILLLC
jgi:hypothetical protein